LAEPQIAARRTRKIFDDLYNFTVLETETRPIGRGGSGRG